MPDDDLQNSEYQPRRDELITLQEAAKFSGLSYSHISYLARNGDIWAKKLGRDWFASEMAAKRWSRPIAWIIHSAGSCAYHVLIEWKQWTQWTNPRAFRTARYIKYAFKRPETPICGGRPAFKAYKGKLLLITWAQVRILHGPPYM